MKCGYASGWQGWIQIENFSAWHGLPVATKNNGFDGTDAVLEFNKPEQVKHIALLARAEQERRLQLLWAQRRVNREVL
ncbi:glycerol-3-phosphate ABC transporter [Klebsiella grimontii]|uniref:Glycerol-3-phosphate ABC transporter n=1 Tax=Klebsiella grimontii TaxID=2058152 RepID=A0A7H4NV91_9ENTR|nr:glycerol-3-phosphate ABC transporter [Klebsiella grimontii]